eukprot:TRINITY_DN1155_c0_g3_i2.p1 TRINITY_DN1155_c0_g3~~TRINITY_DN1155_c0_g3_i2.p1  ORF type:complete len:436 (+),score=92.29 TRINITY_DN1155_c0_g3_i2:55-1308(+)
MRIKNASQLVAVCNKGETYKAGKDQNNVVTIQNGTVIVDNNGKILDLGTNEEMESKYGDHNFQTELDATGMCVLPGLCDAHTHPVWSGDRVHEFAMKLAGATYMEIHEKGGGIGFTVKCTKESTHQELQNLLLKRLWRMIKFGTTLVEAKSGYGLETETEIKMLKILETVKKQVPVDIVTTFLAHSIPSGSDAARATEDIIQNQLPAIKERIEKGEIKPKLIDVFCEKGVFETEHARRILESGKELGLEINFHGDEIAYTGSAELGGSLGALAISHLEKISDEGISALAVRPTVAVLLPTTAYVLRLAVPPARKLIQNNVPVALGTDFNPNAHCLSMPFVMNLACVTMGMTLNEALVASTINAAASMNCSKTHGSLEVGKFGDFIILDAPCWEHLIYQMVDPPITSVIKKGVVVYCE